jgi:hypothetical protein
MQLLKAFAVMIFLLLVQRGPVLEKRPDGVIVSLDGGNATAPLKVRVQICSENIFRVLATPEADFSARPSLIADKAEWMPVDWELKEDGDYVWLVTSRVRAKLHRTKGTVAFYDSSGKMILRHRFRPD